MVQARHAPIVEIALAHSTEVLSRWVHDALLAASDAAVLLDDPRMAAWTHAQRHTRPWIALLEPAYDALARRYAEEVDDGRQHDLFAGDTDTRLVQRWFAFAGRWPFRPGQPLPPRWILMAALGLDDPGPREPGALSRVQAANLLVGHVLTAPIGMGRAGAG